MNWMNGEHKELEFSNELDAALSQLRANTRSCPKPQLLQASQAGILDPKQTQVIAKHIEGCRLCKCLLSDMEELDDLELDKHTRERISNRVKRERDRKPLL